MEEFSISKPLKRLRRLLKKIHYPIPVDWEKEIKEDKEAESGMKSDGLVNNNSLRVNNNTTGKEDEEDMACQTNYGSSFCPRPNRPTMISAKYRQREERRKVLKISINKLKKIEDPESSLRRSVLINNTMKRLQREAREEKMQKQERVYGSGSLGKDEAREQQLVDITNLPKKEEEENRRKRSLEEEGEDVQAVLSQFYMPLTPRMLTSIDDDEEEEIVNVVDLEGEPGPKRARLEETSAAERLAESERAAAALASPYLPLDQSKRSSTEPAFSCGHSSMLNELQSVVYHSLMASLET